MKWLDRLRGNKPIVVKTVVVLNEPEWTGDDAANLATFLRTNAGEKLIEIMHHQVTMMCMSGERLTDTENAERYALRMTIAGIYTHADIEKFENPASNADL